MCGLFGFTDTKRILTPKQVVRLTGALACASEVRGIDATGIAFNTKNGMQVYKRPFPAHRLRVPIPSGVHTVMGHVRFTTQGSEKKNRNNHPFIGKAGDTGFSLAHNGVIQNDLEIRNVWNLPQTKIQTDSYVVVQMLEKLGEIDFQNLAAVSETLIGTYSLTLMNDNGSLFLIKGNNPIHIAFFEMYGIYVYASTKDILNKAISKTGFLHRKYKEVKMNAGDILCINIDGSTECWKFDTSNIHSWNMPYNYGGWYSVRKNYHNDYYGSDLMTCASNMGYHPDDVLELLEAGYCEEEVEELLANPFLFEECLMQV